MLNFLIDNILNLYEHQSTFNPNMPMRGFSYLSSVYRKYIDTRKLNLFSSKLVRLPLPQYIVFYNGISVEEDRTELLLSDAFLVPDKSVIPCLEFKAIMLNINYGYNEKLLNQCVKLSHYSQFIAKIREYQMIGMKIDAAVNQAVDDCIRDGILAEILSANRAEVLDLILTEYDEQSHIASEKEISYEEGVAQGMEEGLAQGMERGMARLNELTKLLIQAGRMEDILRGTEDPEYQEVF